MFTLLYSKNSKGAELVNMIERQDTEEIRNLILNISYKKWEDLGFSKGTLHPMKQKAKENKPFYLTENVKKRLLNQKIVRKII